MKSRKETTGVPEIVRMALAEDVGSGDVTTDLLVPGGISCDIKFVAKAEGVVAGWNVVKAVFQTLDKDFVLTVMTADGSRVKAGDVLAVGKGKARAALSGERTALNLLQRMSGIATATRGFVDAIAGTKAIILDTRKTAPGLRSFDKEAVRIGGGQNHRIGLFDMVLIKENHAALAGGVGSAVRAARKGAPKGMQIEVEVRDMKELREALDAGPDRILLDNMAVQAMKECVSVAGGKIPLEASGNVSLTTVRSIAETGVDFISVGGLTHSVKALDISMLIEPIVKQ